MLFPPSLHDAKVLRAKQIKRNDVNLRIFLFALFLPAHEQTESKTLNNIKQCFIILFISSGAL